MVAHSFDVQEAVDYGVEEAIMIWNLRFWIIKNKANKKHEYAGDDGVLRTWSYNTIEAFQKLFPYWKKGTIERNLNRMIEKKVLIKGNFNRIKFEQTKWYAFFEESKFLAPHLIIGHFSETGNGNLDSGKSKSRNEEIENSETENGNPENEKYKTDNNLPNEKPNKKPNGEKGFSEEKKVWSVEEVLMHLNELTRIEVAKLGYDIFWLAEKYAAWITKIGEPSDFNVAFPAWAEKFTAKQRKKNGNTIKLDKNQSAAEQVGVSPEIMRNRIKHLFQYDQATWKEYFAPSMLEFTPNGWIIKVKNVDALAHQELLQQINVRIEVV